MKTTTLYVEGMHCNSCKILVENSLIQLPNIQAVDVNIHKGEVWIQYENNLNLDEITSLIRKNGYKIVDKPVIRPWLSKNIKDYKIAIISLISFFVLYMLLQHTWLFGKEITSSDSPSLGVVLIIGLTAGFSSCMAVVGGLVLAISSKRNQQKEEQSFWAKIVPHFRFNAGRIIGFAILGGILGGIGQAMSLSPFLMSVMMFIVGMVMLLLGVNLSQLSPKLSSFSLSLPIGKFVTQTEIGILKEKKCWRKNYLWAFGSGVFTFFLPCGFTFAMQLYAMSTGSFRMGMTIMALFAIGTLPWLLGVGSLTSIFKGKTAKVAYQVIGILVLLLGAYNIHTSYGVIAATLSAAGHPCDEVAGVCKVNESPVAQDVEIVQMTYTKDGLSPTALHLELGKKYQILIDVQTTVYGCMSTIYLPGLDSNLQSLKAGTTVEFNVNAEKAGTYEFDCAMGVPHGTKVSIA